VDSKKQKPNKLLQCPLSSIKNIKPIDFAGVKCILDDQSDPAAFRLQIKSPTSPLSFTPAFLKCNLYLLSRHKQLLHVCDNIARCNIPNHFIKK
jgi:hypothetical protein